MSDLYVPSFDEIVAKSYELYKQNFKQLFTLAFSGELIVSLMTLVFSYFLLSKGLNQLMYATQNGAMNQPDLSVPLMFVMLLMFFVFVTVILVVIGGCQHIINESWQSRFVDIKSACQYVASKLLPLLGATLMVYFLLLIGLMLWIVPALIIATMFFVYIPIILFSNETGFGALILSVKMVWTAFLQTFGMMMLTGVLLMLPDFVAGLINLTLTSASHFGLGNVVGIFLTGIIMPFVATLILAQYYALHARWVNHKHANEAY